MKKTITFFVLCVAICSSMIFIGCGADPLDTRPDHDRIFDAFVKVASVSYNEQTRNSTFFVNSTNEISISAFIYDNAPSEFRLGNFSMVRQMGASKSFPIEYENLVIGETYYTQVGSTRTSFIFQGVSSRYLQVRIIDSRTIVIKTYDGQITQVAVDNYTITYFL
jgi:hypothetical protein